MKIQFIMTLIIGSLTCAGAKTSPLMDVERLVPDIILDIRYHTSYNFVGVPIDGYNAAKCLLSKPAAKALAAVQKSATARHNRQLLRSLMTAQGFENLPEE